MKRVAINGFGRIGRAFLRLAFGDPEFEIVAINDPFITPKEARYLLLHDSVYGRYDRNVVAIDNEEKNEKGLEIDGTRIPILAEKEPEDLPWCEMTVHLVIESTGVFRAYDGRKGASKHLRAGAKRVLLSVPSKGEGAEKIPQIVFGVNHKTLDSGADVVSAASCTTNSLVPVVYVLEKEIGIENAYLTTVHGYTADQQLVDKAGSSLTRSRAAAINIVPTTTGAALATTKVLPSLDGKMNGMALRVPVATGSVSDVTLQMSKPVDRESINALFAEYAAGDLSEVLGVSEDPMVSTDVIADSHASVVDLSSTAVLGERTLKVVAFYDNEWGYTNQLLRVARIL